MYEHHLMIVTIIFNNLQIHLTFNGFHFFINYNVIMIDRNQMPLEFVFLTDLTNES